jgi:hypothetical protein
VTITPAVACDEVPTWSTPAEAARLICRRRNLLRTVGVAAVVGTVLFCINQLDIVVGGNATSATWLKGALTYAVPFCVANYGVLTATHRHRSGPR